MTISKLNLHKPEVKTNIDQARLKYLERVYFEVKNTLINEKQVFDEYSSSYSKQRYEIAFSRQQLVEKLLKIFDS